MPLPHIKLPSFDVYKDDIGIEVLLENYKLSV